jgi:hypothetical protein
VVGDPAGPDGGVSEGVVVTTKDANAVTDVDEYAIT